jgi:hypothetical protein
VLNQDELRSVLDRIVSMGQLRPPQYTGKDTYKMKAILCLGLRRLALAMLLAGCATPSDMRSAPPSAEYRSDRPSKDVAICIADRWESSGGLGATVPIKMRPTSTGYTVSVRNDAWGHTAMMVDVDDNGPGARTTYFKQLVLGEGAFDKIVAECQ